MAGHLGPVNTRRLAVGPSRGPSCGAPANDLAMRDHRPEVRRLLGGGRGAHPQGGGAGARRRRAEGHQLVVVVSAMGDTTDELLALAKQVSADPPRRELDMLLTCGERISMALLSMALHELGVPAISFTGSQSGIITDDAPRPGAHRRGAAGAHPRGAGAGQGGHRRRLPGRLAAARGDDARARRERHHRGRARRGARRPRPARSTPTSTGSSPPTRASCPRPRSWRALDYDEMQELAAAGAQVLNAQAVEWAKANGIVLHAQHAHLPGTGTRIAGPGAGQVPVPGGGLGRGAPGAGRAFRGATGPVGLFGRAEGAHPLRPRARGAPLGRDVGGRAAGGRARERGAVGRARAQLRPECARPSQASGR